ncbi:MAG: hypothetical protein CL946_01825, partial [Ectothiorhodospiraceae bacterium]|nr:hypothetical protein [Ectothiorhodospiraceae bacterium]
MLTLYLVCLGFGGILLALQMLTGGSDMDHDAGADIDHDLDMHTDVDHSLDIGDGEVDLSTDVDADTSVDLQSDVGHDIHPMHTGTAPEHVQPQDVGDSIKFFSLRTVIFFTAFFGLTGSVLSWMSIAFLPTLLSAVGMGGFA